MKLTWRGHACFLMENKQGVRIAIDPFDASVGYPMRTIEADAVAMSHGHHDHCCRDMLAGEPAVIDTPGAHAFGDVKITGFESFHDDQMGALRGKNIVFLIEMDGVRLLHLGDLGHALSREAIDAIKAGGEIDVLMIPVGGTYTLTGEEAARLAKAIGAKVTIPMHYKAECVGYPITDEMPFLIGMGAENAPCAAVLELTAGAGGAPAGVMRMDWKA